MLIRLLFLAAQTLSLKLNSIHLRVLRPSAHHGDVERPQVGVVGDLAGHVAPLAQRQRGADALGARGVLYVLQPFGPGRGAHQPQEDQDGRERKVLAGGEKKNCGGGGQTMGFNGRERKTDGRTTLTNMGPKSESL